MKKIKLGILICFLFLTIFTPKIHAKENNIEPRIHAAEVLVKRITVTKADGTSKVTEISDVIYYNTSFILKSETCDDFSTNEEKLEGTTRIVCEYAYATW